MIQHGWRRLRTAHGGRIQEASQWRVNRIAKGEGMMNAEREWINMKELQDLLGIGHTKAYSLIASGEIPSVRIGRIIRINRRDLDRWLERQTYAMARK